MTSTISRPVVLGLAWLVGGGATPAPEHAPTAGQLRLAQVLVRQRIIIRVPEGERRVVSAGSTLVRWREGNGPRCVPARDVIGATMGQSSVDLIMRDNRRVRARLAQRCAGLDYYRGFYVNATADGRICANRDPIRSRLGGECGIAQFRTLQAVRRP